MTPLDTSAFIGKFVEEARDRLKALSGALLRLEQAPGAPASKEAIGEAKREAHSLKGSALMFGFTDMSQVSHQLEDLFVAGGQNPSLLNSQAFDLVSAALDLLSMRVEQLARGILDPVEIGELCRQLAKVVTPAGEHLDAAAKPHHRRTPAERD